MQRECYDRLSWLVGRQLAAECEASMPPCTPESRTLLRGVGGFKFVFIATLTTHVYGMPPTTDEGPREWTLQGVEP